MKATAVSIIISITITLVLILLYKQRTSVDADHAHNEMAQAYINDTASPKLSKQHSDDADRSTTQSSLNADGRRERPINRFKFASNQNAHKTGKDEGEVKDWIVFHQCPYQDIHKCRVQDLCAIYEYIVQ